MGKKPRMILLVKYYERGILNSVYSEHTRTGGFAVIEATSCGGVVIFRGKILLLYKNYKNRYEGWVLPKGTVEQGEEFQDTAIREVREETGVDASIIKYIGRASIPLQYRRIRWRRMFTGI